MFLTLTSAQVSYDYGYSHMDGSEVFFDSNGKLIAINDNILFQCRLPNLYEKLTNDYQPQSIKNKLGLI